MNKILKREQIPALLHQIRGLIAEARSAISKSVDFLQVWTNFHIGRMIVEYEQKGSLRAEYADQLLVNLSKKLSAEFGRGFSRSNLEYFRKFYLTYRERISQSLIGKSSESTSGVRQRISQSPIGKSLKQETSPILLSVTAKAENAAYQSTSQSPIALLCPPGIFALSWTHYLFLMSIDDPDERSFYEIESASQNWSVRELKRQFNTSLYERLALSRDKLKVKELSQRGHIIEKPEDALKQPYVLEFLGLDEKAEYSETELETAIINKIEHFLLELGKGFLFEARQKRISIKEKHFHVDLVFYNRLLRCYVLVDLKIGELTHQDIGQMQMYVNHYDRSVKLNEENPTVGIILCKHHEQTIVEMTLPKDNKQIFAGKYRLLFPSKAQLRRQIESVVVG